MDAIFALLVIVISVVLSASKKKKNMPKNAPAQRAAAQNSRAGARRPAAQPARKNDSIPEAEAQPEEKNEADDGWADRRGGSIEMPAAEPHEHEGKPMPCPAEERERPRPRLSQLAPEENGTAAEGLGLDFSRGSVVQAVVMAEILKRPEFKNGRRVIR